MVGTEVFWPAVPPPVASNHASFGHPPVPTARTLKPTLTARHHLEQHDPRPSRLSAPKITQTCGPVSSRKSTRPILWHARLPHNNQKAYVHIYRARLGHVSIPLPPIFNSVKGLRPSHAKPSLNISVEEYLRYCHTNMSVYVKVD